MGVPVMAQRAWALSWQTAIEVWTLGFLMLWASSRITRVHLTRSKGEERDAWRRRTRVRRCTAKRVHRYDEVRRRMEALLIPEKSDQLLAFTTTQAHQTKKKNNTIKTPKIKVYSLKLFKY